MESIFIIIPILNEQENIPRLIKSFRDINEKFESIFNFIIVDDGSTDDSIQEIKRLRQSLNVIVLEYGCNKGPGYAFATGFEYIADKITEDDIVVTMEGDNTSRIETLYLMISRLKCEKIDCVLASPYAYGGGITNTGFLRTFLSHVANTFIKEMLGIRGIHTMSSFFRVYDAKLIMQLQKVYQPRILMMHGFESMIELLKKIILLESSISEMSMKLDSSLRQGKSKMKIMKTIFGYFSLYFKQKDWESEYEFYLANT